MTDTAFRFPTYREVHGEGFLIPVLPDREIFEEVKEAGPHAARIEVAMSREPWSFQSADERVIHAMLDDGWAPHPYGMLVPPTGTGDDPQSDLRFTEQKGFKDRTKTGPTPKRKEREPGMRGSEGGCYS